MKRYILKSALLILGMATLISCDEDTVTYGGKNFVTLERVATDRLTFFEHLGVSEIPVNLAFPVNHDVIVKFSVDKGATGTAEENVDYTVESKEVVIPAGATSGLIKINVINNDVQNDSKAFEIRLTEVSDTNITLGVEDEGSKFKRFLIVNDDCTTNFFDFVGEFYVTSTATGDDLGIATVDVNDNGDCNIIRISGPIGSSPTLGDFTTDRFLEFTMAPAGTNKNSGSLTAVQQALCTDCWTYQGNEQTLLYTGGGSFSTNLTTGVRRININGNLTPASGIIPSQTMGVILEKITE